MIMKARLTLFVLFLCMFCWDASASLRFQKHVPELKWLTSETAAPDEKLEAIILAPRGLSCRLPAKDGFCRIPLVWLTTLSTQASLWRDDGSNPYNVAYAYDGLVDAYVRYGQTLKYSLHDGKTQQGKLLDAAILTAQWDDSWATTPPPPEKSGELVAENEGACQIFTGFDSCEVAISWSTQHVSSASVWQRTTTGLKPVFKGASEGNIPVDAFAFPSVYELREGDAETGTLLASTITKGFRVKPEGSITLPDGDVCILSGEQKTCGLRAQWQTNDLARLWVREIPISNGRVSGQNLVNVDVTGSTVDLRAGTRADGPILARTWIKAAPAEIVTDENGQKIPVAGSLKPHSASCSIPYSGNHCQIIVDFEMSGSSGSVWNESGELMGTGRSGSFTAMATAYGQAYHLKKGSLATGQILASYIASGIKLTYTGSLAQSSDTPTTCEVGYQRGTCTLAIEYSATDRASIWNTRLMQRVAGGKATDTVSVTLYNHDGLDETINRYDLRIHGGSTPRATDPLLDSISLRATRPAHEGSVAPYSSATCNMIYSREECEIRLRITSTSPVNSLWREDTQEKVWQGGTETPTLTIPSGERTYVLREGDHVENDVLSTIKLKANRPNYYMRLSAGNGGTCVGNYFNGSCSIAISSVSNTKGQLFYRDVTFNSNSSWTSFTSSITSTTSTFTAASLSRDRVYEIEARQFDSPYEPLDRITVTASLNEPHSFTMLSPPPGGADASSAPCSTFYNSASCLLTWDMNWETSSPTVSICRRTAENESSFIRSTDSSGKRSEKFEFQVGLRKVIEIYEGNVSCFAPELAQTLGYRLLYKHEFLAPRVIERDKTPAYFNASGYSCLIYYKGYGSCKINVGFYPYQFGYEHDSLPYLYIVRQDGSDRSSVYNDASNTRSVTISEGEQNVIYELRVANGTFRSESDPIVDTVTLNHGYNNFTGTVIGSRLSFNPTSESALKSSHKSAGLNSSPYFFTRTIAEDDSLGDVAYPCYIHAEENTCIIRVVAALSAASSGASIFVDGVFITGFTDASSSHGRVLQPGLHAIELREGIDSKSINNRLLDKFTIDARRPNYIGMISLSSSVPDISYYGAVENITLTIQSTTSGYLYNKKDGEVICSVSKFYTANHWASKACSVEIVEGINSFELRTHQDALDPDNKVLAAYSVEGTRKDQRFYTTTHATYPEYFSTCPRTFTSNSCTLYFRYFNAYANSTSNAFSICAVRGSSNTTYKRGSAYGATSWTSKAVTVIGGDTEFLVVDGPTCPNLSSSSIPILKRWSVSTTEPTMQIQYGATSYQYNGVGKSGTDVWSCYLRYENDHCYFQVYARLAVENDPGQPKKAYLALYRGDSFLGGDPVTYKTSFAQPAGKSGTYHVVLCNGAGTTAATCPKTEQSIQHTFVVKSVLSNYTGSITAPDGDTCDGQYGVTKCSVRLVMNTTSSYVTVHQDGVNVGSITDRSEDAIYEIPLKANGQKTVFELRDGTTGNGRVLATKEITATLYDPGRFKFIHSSPASVSSEYIDSICIVSSFVAEEFTNTCSFDVRYESDESVKYIKVTSGASEALGTFEVSGNGSIRTIVDAAIRSYPNRSHFNTGKYLATVYADKENTFVMDRVRVLQRNTIFSEDALNGWSNLSVVKGNSYLSSTIQTNGTRWFISSAAGYLLPLYSQDVVADDLTLTLPSACSNEMLSTNSYPCNTIDFMRTTFAINASSVESANVSFANSVRRVKRIFYRVATPSVASYLADPTISYNGKTRPIEMDGQWHYITVPETISGTVTIKAINTSTSQRNLLMDWFAEYYYIN